jgi:predicted acyltransferase
MAATERFTALDVFRGMTVCFMIIVNTPGNGATSFSPLQHAHWHGFTPTDLVFPSFLFAVGNAMSFAMLKWSNLSPGKVWWKILKRTFIIFLLGYLMYWFPFVHWNEANQLELSPFSNTRVFGVLQRIALAYCAASFIVYYCKPKTAAIIGGIILLLYWLLLYWPAGDGDPLGMMTNNGTRLDRWLLADSHLYHGEGVAFDPEGLLGTLPSVVNVLCGFLVGKFLQQKGKTWEALSQLLLAGFALITIAYFWDLVFPINKKLWTSSFVLYTVGLDCIILSAVIYIIDFKKKTKWNYFFEVFGRNPLFIYLLSEVGAILLYFFRANPEESVFRWLFNHIFRHAGMYVGSLLFAICFMLLCWLVGYWMDKKKIYVRV